MSQSATRLSMHDQVDAEIVNANIRVGVMTLRRTPRVNRLRAASAMLTWVEDGRRWRWIVDGCKRIHNQQCLSSRPADQL